MTDTGKVSIHKHVKLENFSGMKNEAFVFGGQKVVPYSFDS